MGFAPFSIGKKEFDILGMDLVITFGHWEWDLEKTFSWNLVFHQNLGWEMVTKP